MYQRAKADEFLNLGWDGSYILWWSWWPNSTLSMLSYILRLFLIMQRLIFLIKTCLLGEDPH